MERALTCAPQDHRMSSPLHKLLLVALGQIIQFGDGSLSTILGIVKSWGCIQDRSLLMEQPTTEHKDIQYIYGLCGHFLVTRLQTTNLCPDSDYPIFFCERSTLLILKVKPN